MTKKSLARVQRDAELKDARSEASAQIKGNTIYDEMKNVYTVCAETLVSYGVSLNELCIDELVPHMSKEQKDKVITLTRGYSQDISKFADDLLTINKPFVGKTGGEESIDDYMGTVGVIQQYEEFIGRCKGTLDPMFNALATEITMIADSVVKTQNDPATDPNVVTDVQIKEPGV